MSSGNAKRKKTRQRHAQRSADKSHRRDRSQTHRHLPKVGTSPEQEHLRHQRQADLVDFGRVRTGRWVTIGLVVVALVAIAAFLVLILAFD